MDALSSSRSGGQGPSHVHIPKYLACEASISDSDVSLDGWTNNADKALASIRSPTRSDDLSDIISFKSSVRHERTSPQLKPASKKAPAQKARPATKQAARPVANQRAIAELLMLDSPTEDDTLSTMPQSPPPMHTTTPIELTLPLGSPGSPSRRRPYAALKASGKAFSVPRPRTAPERSVKSQLSTGRTPMSISDAGTRHSKSSRELIVEPTHEPLSPQSNGSEARELPYMVHAKSYGWKLTSQSRRKQIMRLATQYQHQYDNINSLIQGIPPRTEPTPEERSSRLQERQLDALRTVASRRQRSAPGLPRTASRGSISRQGNSRRSLTRSGPTSSRAILYDEKGSLTEEALLLPAPVSPTESNGELSPISGVPLLSARRQQPLESENERDIASLLAPADRYAIIEDYLRSARETPATDDLREVIASEPFLDNIYGHKQVDQQPN